MSKPLKLQHFGVGAFFGLSACATGFLVAGMQKIQTPQFVPNPSGYGIQVIETPTPHRDLYLAGFMGCTIGAAATLHPKLKINGDRLVNPDTFKADTLELIQLLGEGLNDVSGSAFQGLIKWMTRGSGKQLAKTIYVKCAPPALKDAVEEMVKDKTWFKEFLRRHVWLVAKTRAGKTVLLLYLLLVFIQEWPDGYFTICDINFKKPNEAGEVNDWFGIDQKQFIRVEYATIKQTIYEEWLDLHQRRQYCMQLPTGQKAKLQPSLLILEEMPAFMRQAEIVGKMMNTDEKSQILLWLGDLFTFGLGYGKRVVIVSQNSAVGENGINQANQDQLCVALLGRTAVKSQEVKKFAGDDAANLIARVKDLRRRGHRAAIVQVGDDDPAVRVIPNINVNNVRLEFKPFEDPDYCWWIETYTPEVQEWLLSLAKQYLNKEIKSPLKTEIAPYFEVQVTNQDARYNRFVKEAWADAQAAVEQELARSKT
ncbi:hypothetical protein NDA01_21620 [Trichocoleus desertorum AS-A10]|uniref:hypothetical protein n=1 Tax=Trichocoleus desertorum TaxID=1481672 RepID=UPI003297426D